MSTATHTPGPWRWEPSRCWDIWRTTTAPPVLEKRGMYATYREWAWRFGSIYTDKPRRAICAACGQPIEGEWCLRAIDTDTPRGEFTKRVRYLHMSPCIAALATAEGREP